MVSAALVAQREVDSKEAIAAEPASVRPALSLAMPASGNEGGPQVSASEQEEVARNKMVQRPLYFVCSLLHGARSRYSGVQKLIFGLLMASRKLRHYFQAHEITVAIAS